MIDRVITFSVRRRWVVVAAAVALAVWGIRATVRTPVDAIPDLSENQVIVFTEWPGHGPAEIEDHVTYPLTLDLKSLAGVRAVRSSSDVGFSMVSVILEDGVGWDVARKRVSDSLAAASAKWPAGATPRLAPDAAATGQIFWYTVEGPNTDPGRLRAVQDWYVRPHLAAVAGVAEVASVGGRVLEYQVELDPHRLQARGVSPGAVAEAVRKANAAVGGNIVHKAGAEFVARGAGWLGARPGSPDTNSQRVLRDLELVTVPGASGELVPLGEVARVSLGVAPRRGVLDKDGGDATGGVVMMRHGENPLEVTRRLRAALRELAPGLPPGVRIVPVYDRTPLIRGTVGTVTNTLLEAIVTASICILVVLRHVRSALLVAVTLPLTVLFSFVVMSVLRGTGLVGVETNLMSLAGLAISIGVLVDSSVVMAENVMHRLKQKYGDQRVTGDTRAEVLAACLEVGRPIFFSVLIILLSFLPVFALGGLLGKMFHPFAFTKSFAMVGVGLLSITLVPALCTLLVKGRLRSEQDVRLVRGLIGVYRPVLAHLIDRPAGIVWVVGVTFILGAAALGNPIVSRVVVAGAVVGGVWAATRPRTRVVVALSLVVAGLAAERWVTPLKREFLTPLDEGMVMDMPISVPRMSGTQAADDLRARDMILCRFPEVEMVVGKAGRAETAADPAPLDMIETMIGLRPREFWPRRGLRAVDAEKQAADVLDSLVSRGLVRDPGESRGAILAAVVMDATALFDAQMREAAYQLNREFERDLGPKQARFVVGKLLERLDANGTLSRPAAEKGLAPLADSLFIGHTTHLGMDPTPEAVSALARDVLRKLADLGLVEAGADPDRPGGFAGRARASFTTLFGGTKRTLVDALHDDARDFHRTKWAEHTARTNATLRERGAGVFTRLTLEQLLRQCEIIVPRVAESIAEWDRVRSGAATTQPATGHHHGGKLPVLEPSPELHSVQTDLTRGFMKGLLLWPRTRAELSAPGGELDRAMQMPGWTNVWTMPIQNRVDMLATGVNTTVGVRILGRRLDDVVKASEDVAAVLKTLPGAADVICDPVRGKGQLEVTPDRANLARHGADPDAVTDLVAIALGGRVVTSTVEGRERHPVRVRYARAFRQDEQTVRDLPVLVRPGGAAAHVPLSELADVRISEGPASIKGENGLLRNYVRLNVRGRDATEFVSAARQAVATRVKLPDGVFVEWTGQFEHEARSRETLAVAVPAAVLVIFLILWWTYRDATDALLMLLAVPGALAGGLILMWLMGEPLSVAAWVGYIACFGMATSTGIIMLVYLRHAVAAAGGEGALTPERLRDVVLDGAAHRLRPKLLTEATTLLGLAPLLLATGPGAEVLRPMVVPVIGGLLIADEVIDLFLPVLFYRTRLRRLAPVQ